MTNLVVYEKSWNSKYREEVEAFANLLGHKICGEKNKDETICQLRPISKEQLERMGKKEKPNGRCGIHGGYVQIHTLALMDRLNTAITDKYRGKKIEFNANPYLYLFKKCENCPVADICPESSLQGKPCPFETQIMDNIIKMVYSNYELNANVEKLQLMELAFMYIRKFRVEYYSTFMNDVNEYIRAMTIISKLSGELNKIMKDMGLTSKQNIPVEKKNEMTDLALELSKDEGIEEFSVVDDGEKSGIQIKKRSRRVG